MTCVCCFYVLLYFIRDIHGMSIPAVFLSMSRYVNFCVLEIFTWLQLIQIVLLFRLSSTYPYNSKVFPHHFVPNWSNVFSAAVLHLVSYANMCTSVQVLTLRIRVDVLIDKSQFHHEDDHQVVSRSEVLQAASAVATIYSSYLWGCWTNPWPMHVALDRHKTIVTEYERATAAVHVR